MSSAPLNAISDGTTRTQNPGPQPAARWTPRLPQDVFWDGHSGYFADPDGYYWEVAWGPMFSFAVDGSIEIGG